jgi:hypothetical protein
MMDEVCLRCKGIICQHGSDKFGNVIGSGWCAWICGQGLARDASAGISQMSTSFIHRPLIRCVKAVYERSAASILHHIYYATLRGQWLQKVILTITRARALS